MDPHTTQKGSRSCKDCHQDPRSLGLGQGNLAPGKGGGWTFTPCLDNRPGNLDIRHALDAFVDIQGRPLVHTSRPWLRPLNGGEIRRILYVGLCLDCHTGWDDKVMASWDPSSPPRPCPRASLDREGSSRPKAQGPR